MEKLKDISLIFGKEGAAVSVGAEAGVLYLVHGGCFRGTALRTNSLVMPAERGRLRWGWSEAQAEVSLTEIV